MKKKSSMSKNILIVSNCTWYLYNFRKALLSDLKNKQYNLILISPIDEYYLKISKFFIKKENLFLVRSSENPILEIITLFHLLLIYLKYKPDLVHHFTIKPCIYGSIIAKLTGIKNNELKNLKGFNYYSSDIYNFLKNSTIVGHDVKYDYRVLKNELKKNNFILKNKFLCTLELMREFYPDLSSYKLKSLSKEFDIKLLKHHRAMDDAKATLELLKLCNGY